jgi:Tol biopolymer transport system component
MKLLNGVAVALVAAGGVAASAAAMPTGFSDWSTATRVEAQPGTAESFNGPALDGCPFISRDGRTFYMASNRPGGLGGIDIWAARRDSPDDPWGAPENLGAPVNSPADDFCPTIARNGHTLFFVSSRGGGCGRADIYVTRHRPDGWDDPRNLGCNVNSAADEASPFPLPEPGNGKVLYFSSVRPGGFAPDADGATAGDSDLYVSERHDGVYGTPELVPGANTAFEDGQPNVRRDGREIFFFSNRPGTLGMADIYAATRASAFDSWSQPFNLGPNVNSANGAETRPSLSWDGTTLYFGSNRPGGEGSTDHYVTTRSRDG